MNLTTYRLEKIGLAFHSLAMPMVYIDQENGNNIEPEGLEGFGELLLKCDFSLLMHSRLAWNENICRINQVRPKNNHWVIRAFKDLLAVKPFLNAKLIILEYGPDIENTKCLVEELNLDANVIWIKKTSRKNLMWLLQRVTIGTGEFIASPRSFWGGTAWEVLASGKPLLQGFNFNEGEFEQHFRFPPPPMLPVKKESDILNHLIDVCDNPFKAKSIGQDALKWFNEYNGSSLAKKWLDLLENNKVENQA